MASQDTTPILPNGLSQAKANALIKWLVAIEDDNDKTHRYSDSEMIQKIGKKIQGDVKCL
jgi:tetrahydromethanopterin S-methyltransferase subunit G